MINLDNSQKSTITLALAGWAARCDEEAKAMDAFAIEYPQHAAKCRGNAAVSREFAADARALMVLF